MKNRIISIMILVALALTACGTASAAQSSKTKSYAGQAELIVGIFKLEGTDQAITTAQASELLPLWEAIKVLAASDTSAQEEVDAAARQIKESSHPHSLKRSLR